MYEVHTLAHIYLRSTLNTVLPSVPRSTKLSVCIEVIHINAQICLHQIPPLNPEMLMAQKFGTLHNTTQHNTTHSHIHVRQL